MRTIPVFIMAATVALLVGIPRLASSQKTTDSSDILKRPTGRVKLMNPTTPDILLQALINAEAPGGIAVKSYCGRFESRFLGPASATLRGVLDAVVLAEPEYAWNVDEG